MLSTTESSTIRTSNTDTFTHVPAVANLNSGRKYYNSICTTSDLSIISKCLETALNEIKILKENQKIMEERVSKLERILKLKYEEVFSDLELEGE